MLSDTALQKLKPGEKLYRRGDRDGMDVAVLPINRREQLGKWQPRHQGGAVMRAALTVVMTAMLAMPAAVALAKSLDCASWPKNMALVHLKNAGLIDIPSVIDAQTRAVRLAFEKIGKDLHQQVYDIIFHTSDGKTIEVITNSRASSEECSMSAVDVFVVSTKIGGSAKLPSEGTTKK